MKHNDMKEGLLLAEASMSAMDKFIDSIEKDEIKEAFNTLRDSHSAKLLSLMPIQMVMMGLVTEGIISKEQFSDQMARLVSNQHTSLSSVETMICVHIKRLQGKDYFDGKEI